MHYVECPGSLVQLKDALTDAPLEEPKSWATFVRLVFCDPRVAQGIPVLDCIDLRRELAELTPGVWHAITDEQHKVLSEACNKPSVFGPAWIFSARDFFAAIVDAPTKKPSAEEPKA